MLCRMTDEGGRRVLSVGGIEGHSSPGFRGLRQRHPVSRCVWHNFRVFYVDPMVASPFPYPVKKWLVWIVVLVRHQKHRFVIIWQAIFTFNPFTVIHLATVNA